MKLCIVSLAIFCLALAVAPAWAGDNPGLPTHGLLPAAAPWAYDNGPINGTTDAWEINFGYVVSDTFVTHQTNQYQWVAGFELWRLGIPRRHDDLVRGPSPLVKMAGLYMPPA